MLSYVDKIDMIEKLKAKYKISDMQLDYLKSLDVYDSLHIEGNTLSRSVITAFLENGITVHNKPFKEFLEVKDYSNTLSFLRRNVDKLFILTPMFIKSIHRTVTQGLFSIEEDRFCGGYRDDAVFLRGSVYVPPYWEEVPKLVEEVCEKYNGWTGNDYTTRFENIITTYRMLESVHPFFDGNGRTGRIIMNYLLLCNDYPFLWIPSIKREGYLKSFSHLDDCIEFHADCLLNVFDLLAGKKYGKDMED